MTIYRARHSGVMMLDKLTAIFGGFTGPLRTTYEKGLHLMKVMEKRYREDAKVLGLSCKAPKGLLQARLFGSNFAVSAMTLSLGAERKNETERVYLALLKKAQRRLRLKEDEVRALSTVLLKEQTRALNAEMRNVGSGQFALAALYEIALESESGGFKPGLAAEILGRTAAEMLGEWAALYRVLAGKPMQTYSMGFKKSSQDSRRLGEE